MKINVKVEVSYSTDHHTFDLEDLGVTEEEWDSLTNEQKEIKIQSAVDSLPESPYWMVDTWSEDD